MTTKAQRDELVAYIDDKAGIVPTAISNQLAILDEVVGRMPAGEDKNKLRSVFSAIMAANLRIGTSPGEEQSRPGVLLWLRQKLLALPVDDDPPPVVVLPPVSVAPGRLESPLKSWETRRLIGEGGAIYWCGVEVAGLVSMAVGAGTGIAVAHAVLDKEPVAGVTPKWTKQGSGSTTTEEIRPGQWYAWTFTGADRQEMRPQLKG